MVTSGGDATDTGARINAMSCAIGALSSNVSSARVTRFGAKLRNASHCGCSRYAFSTF